MSLLLLMGVSLPEQNGVDENQTKLAAPADPVVVDQVSGDTQKLESTPIIEAGDEYAVITTLKQLYDHQIRIQLASQDRVTLEIDYSPHWRLYTQQISSEEPSPHFI